MLIQKCSLRLPFKETNIGSIWPRNNKIKFLESLLSRHCLLFNSCIKLKKNRARSKGLDIGLIENSLIDWLIGSIDQLQHRPVLRSVSWWIFDRREVRGGVVSGRKTYRMTSSQKLRALEYVAPNFDFSAIFDVMADTIHVAQTMVELSGDTHQLLSRRKIGPFDNNWILKSVKRTRRFNLAVRKFARNFEKLYDEDF